jgi:hypothetical protein
MDKKLEMPASPESEAAIAQIACEAAVVEVLVPSTWMETARPRAVGTPTSSPAH